MMCCILTRSYRALRPKLWAYGLAMIVGGVMLAAPVCVHGAVPAKKKYEDVTLRTRDGVILKCTYYASEPTKHTVPVILVHDWNSSRASLHPLALALQRKKHSVIVPDLRGHGQSIYVASPLGGEPAKIIRDKMSRTAIGAMVVDIETAKRFLLEKNNKGEVNIEQLCIVGCGFGGTIALNWAALDWNRRSLPAYKLGQDVKAIGLVSPVKSFHGVTAQQALAHPVIRKALGMLILVGADEPNAYADAKRVYRSFERFHGKDAKDLGFLKFNTSLQGARLINAKGLDVPGKIAQFIDWTLVRQAGRFAWRDRTSPLDQNE